MLKNYLAAALSLSLGAVSILASAEVDNAAGESPLTPDSSASPQGLNNADQLFIQLIGIGGQAEVEAGNAAARKGRADAVQQFGKHMVQDHEKANRKLEQIAQSHRIDITKKYDPDHERQRKYLNDLKGDEFDREYLRTQIAEHQRTALLLEWQIGSGQNGALKDYAKETLPTVLEHLQMAKDALEQLVAVR